MPQISASQAPGPACPGPARPLLTPSLVMVLVLGRPPRKEEMSLRPEVIKLVLLLPAVFPRGLLWHPPNLRKHVFWVFRAHWLAACSKDRYVHLCCKCFQFLYTHANCKSRPPCQALPGKKNKNELRIGHWSRPAGPLHLRRQ